MQEAAILYDDFKAFNKRLRYFCTASGFGRHEYIAVAEPQQRGAWHIHCFLIFSDKAPYIPKERLEAIWGHGFVNIKALRVDITNVGAYFIPYLTDMAFSEYAPGIDYKKADKSHLKWAAVRSESGDTTNKAFVKGSRLAYYPAGFRIYRVSRGIKRPIVYRTTEKKARALVAGAVKTFEKTVKLIDENTNTVVNIINDRQYTKAKGGDMT